MAGCDHQPVEEYVPSEGAKVTTCVKCSSRLDSRRLRPQDVPGKGGGASDGVPAASTDPVPQTAVEAETAAEYVAVSGSVEARRLRNSAVCSRQGGVLEPCDSGHRKAHHCLHSKFARGVGKPRTFPGPCACHGCHS